MDIRVRFSKYGPIKYVGHLDLMRYFQKALRRSGLPISFSKGFSPHPVMSFASPLGVGITSEGEYMDFSLESDLPCEEIQDRLNAQMTEGVEILSVTERHDTKKAMAELKAASYLVYFKRISPDMNTDYEFMKKQIDERIKNATSLVVTKKTKKSERQVDLLPLIYEIEVLESFPIEKRDHYLPDWKHNGFRLGDNDPAVYMKVNAASSDNLKPELLMNAVFNPTGAENYFTIGVHRLDMYGEKDGSPVSLGELDA